MANKTITLSATDAIKKIKRGKRIFISSGCAKPEGLVRELVAQAESFADNEIVHLLTLGSAPYVDPKYRPHFRHNALFVGGNVRSAVQSGDADYTPVFLSEIPSLFEKRQLPIHYALIQVSPPDRDHNVSLGVSVDIVRSAALNAEVVIAQVNRNMPRTLGQSLIPLDTIDYLVPLDEPLVEFPPPASDPVSEKIGKIIAEIIADGDTLQMGIGTIPDAILANLGNKNDLGIHTEMFSNGIIPLIKGGNITNARKGLHDGISITSFILGDKKLFELVHDNPYFLFFPSEYTNDPFIIRQNKQMVSINSALQIDLTGQVCADSLGWKFFSGIGGQVDFVRGARRSPGGKSIIALPSTAINDTVSRIVPRLTEGAGVVTTRGDVQYVATEFGIAYLHGRTIRERGLALAQIAHPKFRDELLAHLKEKHYVFIDQRSIPRVSDIGDKPFAPHHRFEGQDVFFRTLHPADEKLLQDFFYSHEPMTIYQRYHHFVKTLPHEEAQNRVTIDYSRDLAIAGFAGPEPYAPMVALARYTRNNGSAEIALTLAEKFQTIGIGQYLLEALIKGGRSHKLKTLKASVLVTNSGMIQKFLKAGFREVGTGDPHVKDFELNLLNLSSE